MFAAPLMCNIHSVSEHLIDIDLLPEMNKIEKKIKISHNCVNDTIGGEISFLSGFVD